MKKDQSQLLWPILIFLVIFFRLYPISAKAQITGSDPELCQLLDSSEVLKWRRDFDRSIELCTQVETRSKSIEDWESLARALNELADIHRNTRDLEESEKYLITSKEIILQHLSETNIEFARNLFYMGKVVRTVYSDELETARDTVLYYYLKAKAISDNMEKTDNNLRADLLWVIGYFYKITGDTDEANTYFKELTYLLNTQFEDRNYKRGLFFFFISMFYTETGDYERSTILAQIAGSILSQADDFTRYVECEGQIAYNYFETQNFKGSVGQYEKMIDLLETRYGSMSSEIIIPIINICQPLVNTGDYSKVIDYSHEAIKIIARNPDYEGILYYIYNNLAEAYEKKGDAENARLYFEKTIENRIKLFGQHHEEVYFGYRYFGEYFERRAMYNNALINYQKSLTALFEDYNPSNVYENPNFKEHENTEQLFYVLFGKSGSLYKLFSESNELRDLQGSFELYQIVYQLLDQLISGNYLDLSSMQLFQRFDDAFNQSIDCAIQLYEITGEDRYLEQSFQFMEKNKYFLLYKALLISQSHTDDKRINASGKVLAMEIDELKQKIVSETNPELLFDLRNQLIRKFDKKVALSKESDNTNDKPLNPDKEIFSIHDAQNLISNSDELIVEYHWSNDHIYAFLIGKEITDIVKIDKTPELLSSIEKYADALANHSVQKDDFRNYTASAYFLYNNLIKPIENRMAHEDRINRLIIVPDGPLSTLPFEAFISSPDTSSNSYWGLDYLCRHYTMSYAYSLQILKSNLSKQNEAENPKMLAMSYSDQIDENSDIEQLRFDNELPYSAEEIDKIRKHIKSTCYLGDDATEELFKELARDYTIIHLALHGEADTTDMFNSRLIFKKDSISQEDGELRAYELYDMDLSKLQMVVLSACETGIGKQYEGEGIFSIARGFAYAGCPSIVMSLWKVNDKTTADLIDSFYRNLKENLPKDEALRAAKLTFIENSDDLNAHPSNWAALITLGNNRAVVIPKPPFQWHFIILITGVIAFILFLLYKKLKVKIS